MKPTNRRGTRLRKLHVTEISLVGRPANRLGFAFTKSMAATTYATVEEVGDELAYRLADALQDCDGFREAVLNEVSPARLADELSKTVVDHIRERAERADEISPEAAGRMLAETVISTIKELRGQR